MNIRKHWKKILLSSTALFWASCGGDSESSSVAGGTINEDPVTPEEVSIALGWHPGEQKWVSNQPDVTKARENLESMLDDCWSNRVAPLQTAFKDILTLAKQSLEETDWRPCRCAKCREG